MDRLERAFFHFFLLFFALCRFLFYSIRQEKNEILKYEKYEQAAYNRLI